MNLGYTYEQLSEIYQSPLKDLGKLINTVTFDSRSIQVGSECLFFAIRGTFRDGHDFIVDAYGKGVRLFIVEEQPKLDLIEAQYIVVKNSIDALQLLAKNHRAKFDIPIIAITGSAGKTMVKEWLSQLLRKKYVVTKSPKSYNSQIGVPMALLELNNESEIGVFEAGISKPGEMIKLEKMIAPTIGIFTSLGSAHLENFESKAQLLREKSLLFSRCKSIISTIPIEFCDNVVVSTDQTSNFEIKLIDSIGQMNLSTAITAAQSLGISDNDIQSELKYIDSVAMRLETFEGINGSTIINDTYNLDLDAFHSSLEYLMEIGGEQRKIALIGLQDNDKKDAVNALLKQYPSIEYRYIADPLIAETDIANSVILIKGDRKSSMERHASLYKLKKHTTYIEINLSNIVSNLKYIKSNLPESTQVLCMVKASSYGSGSVEVARHLEYAGANYLGVAYVDEGIELRRQGIKLPILVMNVDSTAFEDCIEWKLEPAIYSISKLDYVAKFLMSSNHTHFPVHIKIDTGMNRLGFRPSDVPTLKNFLASQPEIVVKSVYSHLSDADNPNSTFVKEQVERFNDALDQLRGAINYPFLSHILNSEGALNFPEYHLDMVRVGIAMYGYSANNKHKSHLKEVISWKSMISQIRTIQKGETVGYGRNGVADKELQIAIIPVGYADGYRRSLSNGKGGVYINGHFCPTIGNVCMDMIMVDVTDKLFHPGAEVEIIGPNQSLIEFANKLGTIPYEVLTSISKRVHRRYINE